MHVVSALLASLGLAAFAATRDSNPPQLVAREWGTFTAVVGSDGFEVPWWTPSLEGPATLPEFVKRPVSSIAVAGKAGSAAKPALLRMETPVIYFYADRPAEVKIAVDTTRIQLTEVYPATLPPPNVFRQTKSEWQVGIRPPQDAVGGLMPPVGERGAHYAHAREVPEAWWVVGPEQVQTREVEKFIFYRGTGNVTMPKRIHGVSDEGPLLVPGKEPLYLVEVDEAGLRWKRIDASAEENQGTIKVVRPSLDAEARDDETGLAAALAGHLASSGLSQAEAAAMVETWREAWLGERGLRVLEILPRDWIDEVLPLAITPAPSQLERVFVARWELLAPSTERQILETLELTSSDEAKIETLRRHDLRRFGAAAFERAAILRDREFRAAIRGVISVLKAPEDPVTLSTR